MLMASALLPSESQFRGPPSPVFLLRIVIRRVATPPSTRPAAPPTLLGPGLSGVSYGPRAFGSGSPSIGHYDGKRHSCPQIYTITDVRALTRFELRAEIKKRQTNYQRTGGRGPQGTAVVADLCSS